MAKRTSVRKFDSEEVQGEGSYVILSSLTVDEIREIRIQSEDPDYDEFEGGLKKLATHILKWDWVDNEGKQLPLPKNDPTVMGQLTNEEAVFLTKLLVEADSKNSGSRPPKPSS